MGLGRRYPRIPSESDFRHVVTSTGSMIVVSNRLPFVLKRNEEGKLERTASAGGLVTAVAPVVINTNGLWVGWPGIHLEDPNEPIPESRPDDITPTAGLKSEKVSYFLSFYLKICT
ncbi:alpha,alpha-trehalose-phosphate synthase [UDP-forming]-like isoform X3 [Agrilus planipennis]|uniref:Alpha,alpha-trehalose-phosphate synthase [UDP-forming]-like isoform X3 n=1 Tax=Agrilus planipennis TaxID=224129 RepID=A0A7F5R9K6_AGRPL|nr:alpha,alpha-trehalose-phosphate synthase [UDP-forming]-like isoform X3 [Agrilus planipennis]